MHIGLSAQVDAEPIEGVGQRGDQAVAGELRVEVGGAKESRQVRAAKLSQQGQLRTLQLGIGDRRVDTLGRLQESRSLTRQGVEVDSAQLGIRGGIARPAQ